MLAGESIIDGCLSEARMRELTEQALSGTPLDGRRVLVLIPDRTRTVPVPFFFRLLCELIRPHASKLDFLVALGTHPPLSPERIHQLLGLEAGALERDFPGVAVYNHCWDKPDELTTLGTISADEVAEMSNGMLREEVAVSINKMVLMYDQIIILAPTFPHEVVGFSGGNKYFVPGVAGPEVLHFFHWLGALITNPVINGTKDTPVRRVVDRAASFIETPKLCISLVVVHDGVKALFAGTPEEAFNAAADVSAKVHIVYKDRPFRKVLAMAPGMYDDIWTAGKCMYKLEPVVADGGELIIYAPHISKISYTHGKVLDRIGYHTRDYFLKQMDNFREVPRVVMAHSTHVKGIGTFGNGVERPRINVVLATAIPRERCEKINLGYAEPDSIDPSQWERREEEGILLVRQAGERLYRLSDGTVPRIPDDEA